MRTPSVGRKVGKGVHVGPEVLVMVGTTVAVGVNVAVDVGGGEVGVTEGIVVGKSTGTVGASGGCEPQLTKKRNKIIT